MYRKATYAAVLSLAISGSVVMPLPAVAAPQTWAVEFCRTEILPDPFFAAANLGECVSYNQTFFNSHEKGFPAHECDYFLELDPAQFYENYDSYSDCVRDYH
jgi:hypothetical protein